MSEYGIVWTDCFSCTKPLIPLFILKVDLLGAPVRVSEAADVPRP